MSVMKNTLAAVAAFCAMSAISHAADYTFVVEKSELSNRAGLERTAKRIDRTANAVCATDAARSLSSKAAAKKCTQEVSGHILSGIDHPELAAIYADRDQYAAR